jgi:hypothetical protein
MITVFDLIAIILPIAGIMFGAGIVKEYGIGWGTMAIITGGLIGRWLGKLPTILMVKHIRKRLAKLSVDEIQERLYNFWFSDSTPNFLLLELRARGEDISQHLDCVLNMLGSESNLRRTFGYAALLSAYPNVANKMRGYNPSKPVEDCKQKVNELRKKTSKTG